MRSAKVAGEILVLRLGALFNVGGMRGRAERLRNALIRLGPAFTKFGQAMATRPDILPREYCEELAKLQDRVPSFPTAEARATVSEELRMPVVDVFEEFSTEPVAAASLAQVYRARLRGSGEIVAVKIQRPNLHETIALDSIILRRLASVIGTVFGVRSDLAGMMDELVGRIFEEIDFIREAESMKSFYEMYDSRPTKGQPSTGSPVGGDSSVAITVPRVHRHLCTRRVLVMEWMSGVKLTDLDALRVMGVDRKLILSTGVRCSLRQLLREGHFHADPHPGNLMATDEGLAYLDFGMMCRISSADRYGLLRLLVSFVNRDAGIMAVELRNLGFLPYNTKLGGVEASIHEAFENGDSDLENKDFQGAVEQLSGVLRAHDFRVPPRYALIIRALGALEGTATLLQPDFKVVAAAYPIVLEFLIEDKSPEMRRILRSMLLTPEGNVRWGRVQRLLEAARSTSGDEVSGDSTYETSDCTGADFASSFKSFALGGLGGTGKNAGVSGSGERHGGSEIDAKLVDAIDDAMAFLESRRSAKVREMLVKDVLDNLKLRYEDGDWRESAANRADIEGGGLYGILGQVEGPAKWIFRRVRSAPEVWFPAIARVTSSRATHEIMYSIVRGQMKRFGRNAVEELILALSAFLAACRL